MLMIGTLDAQWLTAGNHTIAILGGDALAVRRPDRPRP